MIFLEHVESQLEFLYGPNVPKGTWSIFIGSPEKVEMTVEEILYLGKGLKVGNHLRVKYLDVPGS